MRKNNNDFQHKRQVVLFIYDYTCQLCGMISFSNHCHHIDKNGNNHSVYNLIPLCVDCHILVHSANIVLNLQPTASQLVLLQKLASYENF